MKLKDSNEYENSIEEAVDRVAGGLIMGCIGFLASPFVGVVRTIESSKQNDIFTSIIDGVDATIKTIAVSPIVGGQTGLTGLFEDEDSDNS